MEPSPPPNRIFSPGLEVVVTGVAGTGIGRVWRLLLARWTGGMLRERLPSCPRKELVRAGSVLVSCVDLVARSLLSRLSGNSKDADGRSEVECRLVLRMDFERDGVGVDEACSLVSSAHRDVSTSWR